MGLRKPHQQTAHLGDFVIVVTVNGKYTNKTGMRLWFECEVATVVGVTDARRIETVLFARDWRVERRADLANLVALVPQSATQIDVPLAMMAAREHGQPFGSLEEVRAAVRPFVLIDLAERGYDPAVGEPPASDADADAVTEAFVTVADAERYALRDEYVNAERTTLAEQLRAVGAEQAAQDAEADAFHVQRRADEADANGEYVDYAEAEAVREIEREMAIEAGDDSEIDRQVAEDDAHNERIAEQSANRSGAWNDPAVRRAVQETIRANAAEEVCGGIAPDDCCGHCPDCLEALDDERQLHGGDGA